MPLTFPAEEITSYPQDGPYQLRSFSLRRNDTSSSSGITLARVSVAYTTTAYSRYDWERDNILPSVPFKADPWFIDANGEREYDADLRQRLPLDQQQPVDEDGDGLYDYLDVEFPVDIREAGSYGVGAALTPWFDPHTRLASFSNEQVQLKQGTNWLRLRFSGAEIRASGVDGPYMIAPLMIAGSPNRELGYKIMDYALTKGEAYPSSKFAP